jgi:hypothetical protein
MENTGRARKPANAVPPDVSNKYQSRSWKIGRMVSRFSPASEMAKACSTCGTLITGALATAGQAQPDVSWRRWHPAEHFLLRHGSHFPVLLSAVWAGRMRGFVASSCVRRWQGKPVRFVAALSSCATPFLRFRWELRMEGGSTSYRSCWLSTNNVHLVSILT